MGSESTLSVIVIFLALCQSLISCQSLSSAVKKTPVIQNYDSEVSRVSIPDWKVDDAIDSREKAVLEDMAKMAQDTAHPAGKEGQRSELRNEDDPAGEKRWGFSDDSDESNGPPKRSFFHLIGPWSRGKKGHRHHSRSDESNSSEKYRSDSRSGDWSDRSSAHYSHSSSEYEPRSSSENSSGSSEECFCGSNTDFAKDLRRFLGRLKHKYPHLRAKPIFAFVLNFKFWDRVCLFFRDVIMKSVH